MGIASYLPKGDQLRLATTCKAFYHIVLPCIYEKLEIRPEDFEMPRETGRIFLTSKEYYNEIYAGIPPCLRPVRKRPELATHTTKMVLGYGDAEDLQDCPNKIWRRFTHLKEMRFNLTQIDVGFIKVILRSMPKLEDVQFKLTYEQDDRFKRASTWCAEVGYALGRSPEKLRSLCIIVNITSPPARDSDNWVYEDDDYDDVSWTWELSGSFSILKEMTNLESLSIEWPLLRRALRLGASDDASEDSASENSASENSASENSVSNKSAAENESNEERDDIWDFFPNSLQCLTLRISQWDDYDLDEYLPTYISDLTESIRNHEQPSSLKYINILYFEKGIERQLEELLSVCASQKIEVRHILWEEARVEHVTIHVLDGQWASESRALRVLAPYSGSRAAMGKVKIDGSTRFLKERTWLQLLGQWP